MPNKNYIKGRRKEYKYVKIMRDKGFIAQRTAGSHSPFDVIAINPETKQIRLIQCKPDSMNATRAQKIRNENKELSGSFEVRFSVV